MNLALLFVYKNGAATFDDWDLLHQPKAKGELLFEEWATHLWEVLWPGEERGCW